jgi:hypothetical protein
MDIAQDRPETIAEPTPKPPRSGAKRPKATPARAARETVDLRTEPSLPSPAPATTPPPVSAVRPTPSPIVLPPAPIPGPTPLAVLPDTAKAAAPTKSADQEVREFIRLTGVVWDPKTPMAIINDEIVGVGDVVEGVKILAIDSPSSVRVEYRGKQYKLELQ